MGVLSLNRMLKGTVGMGCTLPTRGRERGSKLVSLLQYFLSNQNTQSMYQGVLRDDVRRREKMLQRQLDLEESKKKREIYERAQKVDPDSLQ